RFHRHALSSSWRNAMHQIFYVNRSIYFVCSHCPARNILIEKGGQQDPPHHGEVPSIDLVRSTMPMRREIAESCAPDVVLTPPRPPTTACPISRHRGLTLTQ